LYTLVTGKHLSSETNPVLMFYRFKKL